MQFNDDFWICLDVFSWMSFPWLFLEALPDEAGEAFFVGVGYDVETTKTWDGKAMNNWYVNFDEQGDAGGCFLYHRFYSIFFYISGDHTNKPWWNYLWTNQSTAWSLPKWPEIWFLTSHANPWIQPESFSKMIAFLLNSSARFRNQRAWFTASFMIWWEKSFLFRTSRWIRCCSLWRYWWWMQVATPHVHCHQSDSPMVYLTYISDDSSLTLWFHILVWMNILQCILCWHCPNRFESCCSIFNPTGSR